MQDDDNVSQVEEEHERDDVEDIYKDNQYGEDERDFETGYGTSSDVDSDMYAPSFWKDL